MVTFTLSRRRRWNKRVIVRTIALEFLVMRMSTIKSVEGHPHC